VNSSRIAALLEPFLNRPLTPTQIKQTSIYIDLLLRWNARINLTAVRNSEEIVPRHFGESFFLARHVFPEADRAPERDCSKREARRSKLVVDLGSGAGFPGLPLKIWWPEIHLTLIESNHKKAAFLREVVRALTLTHVDVMAGRAESLADQLPENSPADARLSPGTLLSHASPLSNARSSDISTHPDFSVSPRPSATLSSKPTSTKADVVTFRAVENFDRALSLAFRFLAPHGRLAILISAAQLPHLSAPQLRYPSSQGDAASPVAARVSDIPASGRTGTPRWLAIHVPQSQQRMLALTEPDQA
jgi:16S rRNA (guanine(527)-N(7))-methyltransferase RsmG